MAKKTTGKNITYIIIALAALALILYFFSAVFLPLGAIFLLIGIIFSIWGLKIESKETFAIGALLLILGIILAILGTTGIAIFKQI